MGKKQEALPLSKVQVKDGFWSKYVELATDAVIPYQWEALNDRIEDAAPSYAIRNFRIAAGLEEGEFGGMVFQDSDVAKWLEAVGYSLAIRPDAKLEATADEVIDLIEKAQQPDGYINTYFTVKEPDKRWSNLWECHELYCAGHMMEAAVAYFEATGKRKFLDVMARFADYIDTVFGPEPEKLKGYPGHQEIELALVKMYHATGEERYLKLAQFFIDERGKSPFYFDIEYDKRGGTTHWGGNGHPSKSREYNQYHVPVREQKKATGHAVRAVYMYSGMADIAAETGDQELAAACRTIWENIASKQMYITGGIGSTHHGEAFSFDYDLPNDTVYQETCASIGLIFFAHRMLKLEKKGSYADVMERALYNSVLSGIAMDGKAFFYVNPLEVWPAACERNPGKHHVKPVRQKWYGCACCPPNVARLLSSLGQYIYGVDETTVYTHLYIGGETAVTVAGEDITLRQETNYPWEGKVQLQVLGASGKEFAVALRIPAWSTQPVLKVNGEVLSLDAHVKEGYAYIQRAWKDGDSITLELNLQPILIQSHPQVRANAGKAAIQWGPLAYCLEETDNGENLSALSIPLNTPLEAVFDANVLGGIVVIKGQACRVEETTWGEDTLYRPMQLEEKPVSFTAVPYCMWGNREPGEMMVWVRYK